MRQERTPINGDTVSDGYTFFFQIANNGRRCACCVKVDASNMEEASVFVRQKWSVIEAMARDGITSAAIDNHVITLVMP